MLTKRIAVLGVLCATSLAVVACENAADKQREADKAQVQADQKKAEAQQNAQKEEAKDQQKANEESANAQQKADNERASANQQLTKEQSDYKDKIQKAISDESDKLKDLEAQTADAYGTGKTTDNRVMGDVTAKRDALDSDLQQMGSVSADRWESLKTKIDNDIDAFKGSVKTASSQIKSTPGKTRSSNVPQNNVNNNNTFNNPGTTTTPRTTTPRTTDTTNKATP